MRDMGEKPGGWSLVELLVVTAIAAILATIAAVNGRWVLDRVNEMLGR